MSGEPLSKVARLTAGNKVREPQVCVDEQDAAMAAGADGASASLSPPVPSDCEAAQDYQQTLIDGFLFGKYSKCSFPSAAFGA